MGITEQSSLLLCLSVHYIAGKMMVVRALQAGAMLYVVPPSSHPLGGLEPPCRCGIDGTHAGRSYTP